MGEAGGVDAGGVQPHLLGHPQIQQVLRDSKHSGCSRRLPPMKGRRLRSFIHSFTYPSTHSFIYSFIHLFTHHSFIHSSLPPSVSCFQAFEGQRKAAEMPEEPSLPPPSGEPAEIHGHLSWGALWKEGPPQKRMKPSLRFLRHFRWAFLARWLLSPKEISHPERDPLRGFQSPPPYRVTFEAPSRAHVPSGFCSPASKGCGRGARGSCCPGRGSRWSRPGSCQGDNG